MLAGGMESVFCKLKQLKKGVCFFLAKGEHDGWMPVNVIPSKGPKVSCVECIRRHDARSGCLQAAQRQVRRARTGAFGALLGGLLECEDERKDGDVPKMKAIADDGDDDHDDE